MTCSHSCWKCSCWARKAVPRSKPRVPMATFQPSLTLPITRSADVRASVKKTSLNSADPVSCLRGLTSMPGWSIGMRRNDSPLCLGASGSVRTTLKIQSEWCARVAELLLPLEADVPPRLVGRATAAAEGGVLADEVLIQPGAHLIAEDLVFGAPAEIHGPGRYLTTRSSFTPAATARRAFRRRRGAG